MCFVGFRGYDLGCMLGLWVLGIPSRFCDFD